MNFMSERFKNICVFILFFLTFSYISIENEAKQNDNGHSPYWADQGGYYVYLPLAFNYQMDVNEMPKNIENQFGNGFLIEKEKLKNIYPCGVAILQIPFFSAASIYYYLINEQVTGFEKGFQYGSVIGASFYLALGFLFLYKYLRQKKYSFYISLFALILLFISTNIYFYIKDGQMFSHIYSFSMISLLLYFSANTPSIKNIIYITITISFIILLRNINIVIIPFVFIFNKQLRLYFIEIIKPKHLIFVILIFTIICFPQLLYWKWAYGKWFVDSYAGYGFTNIKNPRFDEVLYLPGTNGHLLFNPIMILLLMSCFISVIKRHFEYLAILFSFIILVTVFASWFTPGLGCGFGNRGLLELYALLAIVFANIVKFIFKNEISIKLSLLFIIGICSYINMKISHQYDGCYYGAKYDINEYLKLLLNNKKKVKSEDFIAQPFDLSPIDSNKIIFSYSENNYDIGNHFNIIINFNAENFNVNDTLFIKKESSLNNITVSKERLVLPLQNSSLLENFSTSFSLPRDYLKCNSKIEFASKNKIHIKVNGIRFE